jgi:hypothetical protein
VSGRDADRPRLECADRQLEVDGAVEVIGHVGLRREAGL